MNTENPVRILFVCMGNICRSPTAHGVFRRLVIDEGLSHSIEIDSAGTHAYHVGEPPDRRARQTARMRGIDIDDPGGDSTGAPALYMMVEGGELDRIAKERFVIGRGKHCDFVINSGKVSREHAVIVRDAGEFFLEDLGSSNGTWFNKQRIKRRKIEDGDEYFICSEKVKFVYR